VDFTFQLSGCRRRTPIGQRFSVKHTIALRDLSNPQSAIHRWYFFRRAKSRIVSPAAMVDRQTTFALPAKGGHFCIATTGAMGELPYRGLFAAARRP
jgi:hypothetical protein